MAQGTGAERLLTLLRKAASAGVIPALAVVVVAGVLAGCGGGSGDETAAGVAQSAGATAQRSIESGKQAAGGDSRQATSDGSEGHGAPPAEGSSGGSGKHGRHITSPKGPREGEPTPQEIAQATVANMTLASPSLSTGTEGVASLPSVYTCDGENSWPALAWQGVPQGTAELVLFAMNVQPVAGKLFFDWAVAGIDPALTAIDASKLPRDAIVGENSYGKRTYSICPSLGSSETYMFALYALPKRLSPARGFDPSAFRRQVLAVSGNNGLLPASYERG